MRAFTLTVALVLGMGSNLQADDKAPDKAAMEQMMMEMAQVGPHHEHFQKYVGKWATKSTDYTTGDEPTVTKGTAQFELILGGRYLKQTFKSEYNGMPFEGMGITGYDNSQQNYVGTWIDNFSTGIMESTGTVDEKTGVAIDMAQATTPLGPMKFKMVTEFDGDDKFLFTMYMLGPDGNEAKHMTIEYTRRKLETLIQN